MLQEALQLGLPASITHNQNISNPYNKKEKDKHPAYYPRFVGGTHVVRLANFSRFSKICQPPNHPRFRQRTVRSTANSFRFLEYVNPAAVIFDG